MSLLDIGTELRHERYFDSHPRVGGDVKITVAALMFVFQFAPPRGGGDMAQGKGHHRHCNFNSHPRVGGDNRRRKSDDCQRISIHTPAWGVTLLCEDGRDADYFNSHPRVGG